MLLTLIKKEILHNLYSVRILVSYLVVFLVVVSSMTIKGVQFSRTYDTYLKNKEQYARQHKELVESEDEDYYWTYDVQAEPQTLAALAEGFSGQITRPYHVEVTPTIPLGLYNFQNPLFMVFKVYDLSFIIAFIISLLAVFISFDTFSGEEERRTLHLVMAHGLPRSTFILGKFIGGYLTVAVPVVLSFLAGLIIQAGIIGLPYQGADYLMFTVILAVCLLFLAVMFLGSVLCSLLFRNSAVSMFYALLFWAVFTFMLPYAGIQTGRLFNSVHLLGDIRKEGELIRKEARAVIEKGRKAYQQSDKKMPQGDFMVAYYHKFNQRLNEMTVTARDRNKENMKRQMLTGMQFARISPAACLLFSLANLAGTGPFEFIKYRDWQDQLRVDNHQSQFNEWQRRDKVRAAMTPAEREQHKKFAYNPDIMPDRHFRGLSQKERFGRSLPDVAVLGLEAVLLFLVSFLVFIRKKKD